MGEDTLRLQSRQGAGSTDARHPRLEVVTSAQEAQPGTIPVSTLMWTFSVPPQRTASALYSSALASQVTVCVMW